MIMRKLVFGSFLAALWLLLTWSLAPHKLAIGLAGVGIITLTCCRGSSLPRVLRLSWILLYLPVLAWDMLVATFTNARLVAAPRPRLSPGTITLATALTDTTAIALLSITLTLIGMNAVVEADPAARQVHLYCLRLPATPVEEQAVIAQAAKYERLLAHIFGAL
jgi:multisubunit Na+/H+ antiporter MnhE subunit